MKKVLMRTCLWLLVLSLMVPAGGFTQDTGSAPPVFRQEELDQMLAPIALYPDSLLIQVLMAATYPLEVVQAARWANQNPNLKGDNLANALNQKYWDPSVKSLMNFPSVLVMMNDKLEWTQNIGDAFLGQKDQVMATIQNLRAKAQAQGTLKTTREQVVVAQENTIVIEPANPEIVYVPAYNPTVVYGPWWYPAYPPYYFYPPGFAFVSAGIVSFGVGVALGAAWGYAWGSVNWADHHVYVNPGPGPGPRPGPGPGPRPGIGPGPIDWQHDPNHRKGVAYKDPGLRQQFGQPGNPGAEARKDFRGFNPGGPDRLGKPGDHPGGPDRLGKPGDHPGLEQRRDAGITGNRQPGERRNDAVQRDRSTTQPNRRSGVIESMNQGGNAVKQESARGRLSRESIPAQKPSQTFQGGKNVQGGGGGFPNIGGRDRIGGGGGAIPNIGGVNRSGGGGGSIPKISGGPPSGGPPGGGPPGGVRRQQ